MGAGSAPVRSSSASRRLAVAALVVLLTARAGADTLDERLDALVQTERADGGWVFAASPGSRPEPFTLAVKTAERWLGPLGLATWDLVVVRSPGTPSAGLALLASHRRTGNAVHLAAARRAGDFLVAAQLRRGGWFSEMPVHGDRTPLWFRLAAATRPMLDDDVTPGAIRLLLALWEATGETRYREAAERGLALVTGAQLPSGAWPLDARPAWLRGLRPHYEDQAAVNDGATPFAISTLVVAARTLGRSDLLHAARAGGDWLLDVQGRGANAGWAQQYDAGDRPAIARAFEIPALASWETRHAIEALATLAGATGDRRYCDGARAGAAWLARVRVGPTCWARLYDIASGAPVYVAEDGARVASSAEARPGYSWMGDYGIPWLLVALGLESGSFPHRLPGDLGRCASDPSPPRPLAGARALIAEAHLLGDPVPIGGCTRP